MSNEVEEKRPLPDIEANVAYTCQQANTVLAQANELLNVLGTGGALGIKPIPQIFPDWEILIRVVPKV